MPGGRRPGAGRPTAHSLKQKAEAIKKADVLLLEEKQADAKKAYDLMKAAADRGEPWAVRVVGLPPQVYDKRIWQVGQTVIRRDELEGLDKQGMRKLLREKLNAVYLELLKEWEERDG
jgi:hypothetical protein